MDARPEVVLPRSGNFTIPRVVLSISYPIHPPSESSTMHPGQTRLVQASFATMIAHGRSIAPFTRHSTVSPSTNSREFIASTTTNIADTVFRLAKDAGEILRDIPYVKALAGIIVQIIQIRDVC